MSLIGNEYGYGDMRAEEQPGIPEPQQEQPSTEPKPAAAFNAMANALIDPVGTVAEVLSPEKVSAPNIPFGWAVVGVCVVLVIWVGSWTEKK